MKKNIYYKKFIFSLLFIAGVFCADINAESFRVSKVHAVTVKQEISFEEIVKLGINDSLAITLPDDQTFIDGLELKFSIPETVAYWIDSVACSVYANIKPTPTPYQIDYSGTKAYVNTLPRKLSWVLQIPLKKDNKIRSNNYTTKVDTVVVPVDNVVFVRLQQVMKGIPEETMNAIIPISVKPILSNKGRLNLTIKSPDKKIAPHTVFIDDNIVNLSSDNTILLETGIHNISIISELYRNEVRTVRIDQAKTTPLIVNMKSIEPTLLITVPDGALVMLDDEKCSTLGTEFVISEGEHKIKFAIGSYEIIKTISAIKGKTYKATFSLDLDIAEE